MKTPAIETPAEAFFYEWAGYSYDPKTETGEQGKTRGAILLAATEAWAKSARVRFEWREDDITSEEFSDEKPFYKLWVCIAYHRGDVIESLFGIDFGRGNGPSGQPYKRVVEAELAIEAYQEALEANRCACGDIETVNT